MEEIGNVPLISAQEKNLLLQEYNKTKAEYPKEKLTSKFSGGSMRFLFPITSVYIGY